VGIEKDRKRRRMTKIDRETRRDKEIDRHGNKKEIQEGIRR
jgi:hypothetical protein